MHYSPSCNIYMQSPELNSRALCACDKSEVSEVKQIALFLCRAGNEPSFHETHTCKLPVDQDVIEPRLWEHRHLNLAGEFPLPFISSPLMEVPLTAGKKSC